MSLLSQNPYCPLCNVLLKENKCPECGAEYHPEAEIMKYQESVSFSHEDEQPELAGVSTNTNSLEAADDEQDPSLIQQLNKKDRPNQGWGAESWD